MRRLNDGAPPPSHARRSLAELLDDVAAETPAPGGGTSAAWATALAAALVEMAASFTLAREEYADRHERMSDLRARAAALRATALGLAERELHAYEPVIEALRLPHDDPARAERLSGALSVAADCPLEIARASAELTDLAAETATRGNRSLEGDALTGALLAEAACRAAARLVQIDLAGRSHDPRLTEIERLVERAGAARSSVPSA
jgi:formiminotetrahydrofolate cyclodeaminase